MILFLVADYYSGFKVQARAHLKNVDLNLDPLSNKNIAQQLVIQDRNIEKGSYLWKTDYKDLDIFEDPIVFKSSDVNQMLNILTQI